MNHIIVNKIDINYQELLELYKHFHQYPELSFLEKETSIKIADELINIGFEVTQNIGGYGVVGILKNGKGKTIMLRADMDALPVNEKTVLPYSSSIKATDLDGTEVPVMHACGHDVHMTVLIGAAKILSELKDKWKGNLMLIAQPAEERSGGAKAMLADGLFNRFLLPDYALALHVSASIESGKIGYKSGNILASVDMVDVSVYGVGGHAAYPQFCIDPVVLAARLILDLQTIVSREISPLEPAVVTVASIHGGSKHNIIPDQVDLQMTIRTFSENVRDQILDALHRICKGLAASANLPEDRYPKISLRDEGTSPTYNDPAITNSLVAIFKNLLGEENVIEEEAKMGGEDFGRYGKTTEKVPICLYWLGSVPKDKMNGQVLPSLHSPYFAPDPEKTIKTGVRCMVGAVMSLLGK